MIEMPDRDRPVLSVELMPPPGFMYKKDRYTGEYAVVPNPQRTKGTMIRQAEVMLPLNPQIDWVVAQAHDEQPSKFHITINFPDGSVRELHYANGIQRWSLRLVDSLNYWRRVTLVEYIGKFNDAMVRKLSLDKTELGWVLKRFQGDLSMIHAHKEEFQNTVTRASSSTPKTISWEDVTEDFNNEFAGKVLSEGMDPRPRRNVVAVKNLFCKMGGFEVVRIEGRRIYKVPD